LETTPIKLSINKEIAERNRLTVKQFERLPIDYVHLRPEHVMPINIMCREHFWNGIDISECLQYPDYTIVALYGKLIVGFALMVPNSALNEAYLSFIFVHPDWRNSRQSDKVELKNQISISQYMLYYLLNVNKFN
jgi:cysteine-rich protein 2-binding protein